MVSGIRIAIIAHGDYCDADKYIVKWIDFGATLPELCDFVSNVERTGGGDGPECYELVLKRAREELKWTPGSQRVLVMIGDNEPHPVGYKYGGQTYYIDWKEECETLRDMLRILLCFTENFEHFNRNFISCSWYFKILTNSFEKKKNKKNANQLLNNMLRD